MAKITGNKNRSVRAEPVEAQVERAQGPSTGSGRTAEKNPSKPDQPKKPRAPRHDGWTPATRAVFLATLRKAGCVRDACRVAAMSSTSAYRLRRQDAEFAGRWKAAQASARTGLIAVAHERAVVGRETVIIRAGKEVERRVTPSDSLLALLIKQGNLTEQDADRLITWEEWQDGIVFDEQGNKVSSAEEAAAVRASLDRKLADMRVKLQARRAREEQALREREARVAALEAKYGEG
ncbi:hypothetical protein HUO14_11885 [Parasphingorhabdus flavimaris]|uniref:Terminase n=1 Tax=Parasphingorhabdus flavimaris TaxID=266812 RepID=A0ABX2N4T0_9SPHN|nr:hypothetical protein [Parasphingorhabdus flavimaris]NVD28603.1 hypothetical protein [Parasphingorhabdus flavimaris]